MQCIKRLVRSESGVISVVAALSMVAILAMGALALDMGRIYLKRGALQTAADAGALAGANSLLAEGRDLDALRTIVKNYAWRNMVDDDRPASALTDGDILFLRDGAPDDVHPNQVEVKISLLEERGNPLKLGFAPILGIPSFDLTVTARAGLVGVCTSKCVKPFVVPTRFTWDDQAAPGTKFYMNGEMDVDSPGEVASVNVIGYDQNDVGTQFIIKPGDPVLAIVPGQYNLVDLPPVNKGTPVTGASAVNENIIGCAGSNSYAEVAPGDELQLEPGNSKGPVSSGCGDLIDSDPGAYWSDATEAVEGSSHGDPMDSPRVVIIAFYDPRQPPVSGRNSIIVHQLGAFFLEGVDPRGNVYARFINTVAVDPTGVGDPGCLLRISRVLLDSSRR
ncbi:pilus assembly protein TadG-related protein [Pseudodesulfovibrio sp.]|uniref:pilus assembly protein TadG-related protein n=1 Tax=Pseudodesulfovibrio sp. TaxID=2035812 RepID=UPI00260FA6E8|nr:pilus assembly protein TadG-related protein [Pseudodesulfovibrio sp.]MDD3312715.1 pilus assembly protein TadG-related protein [Pseudodesulfovibrio sp.]